MKLAIFLAFVGAAAALELTPDNWDDETAGKTVFIKFLAPWCGHCKKMKPDWDKLIKKFEGHATALVADVDCTAEGKPLCDANGVRGFPTIKYGDPSNLEDYQGGRSYKDIEKFAEENLKPSCSPTNIDLCDDDKKAEIEGFQAMSAEDLKKAIKEKEDEQAEAEKTFKKEVEKLQKKYESLSKEKDNTLDAIKKSGLGLMKAVQAANKKKAKAEL